MRDDGEITAKQPLSAGGPGIAGEPPHRAPITEAVPVTTMQSREARTFLWQFCRFASVGVTNTVLSFVVYWLLIAAFVPYPLAGAIGFAAGAVNGYILNRRWTFAAADSRRARARYLMVQLVGLAATTGLLSLFVSVGGLSRLTGYLVTIPTVTIGAFAVNRGWTFAASG